MKTGDPLADALINEVRAELGKGEPKNKRVHNCIGGDLIKLKCKSTSAVFWGVVAMPRVIFYIKDGQKIQSKLCSLKSGYRIEFWR